MQDKPLKNSKVLNPQQGILINPKVNIVHERMVTELRAEGSLLVTTRGWLRKPHGSERVKSHKDSTRLNNDLLFSRIIRRTP